MKRFVFFFFLFFLPFSAVAKTPNDPEYDRQWYLPQIEADTAWDRTTGSGDVLIAVLDAGFDLDHPDLVHQYATNKGEIPKNGKDDDRNGYVDDIHGWDFVEGDADASPETTQNDSEIAAAEHGSLVVGLIAAEGNNAKGVSGILWNAAILPLRVLDETGAGDSIAASAAIEYAIAMGADVINMSFAGDVADAKFRQAIEKAYQANVIIVAAMGNEGVDTSLEAVYPACFGSGEEDWVIGVGATSDRDHLSIFSNYGGCIDLSAPGEGIYGVSYEDDSGDFDKAYQGGWDGTSMAAPLVTGAAALLVSTYPDLTPTDVRNILKLSADPIRMDNKSIVGKVGAGRLNIERALEYAGVFSLRKQGEIVERAEDSGEIRVGTFIKSASYPEVYVVSAKGERKVFLDQNTYFTWSDSFADIEEVSDATLSELKLVGVVLPHPEIVLIKMPYDASVYAIEENRHNADKPFRRKIASEQVAQEIYGMHWADYVIDMDETYAARFIKGTDITGAEEVDISHMKTRAELLRLAQ